eukprot:TRINITY_DN49461_c0_g1_i1.p1 TRINITY_DN49461_c0_g1~~TRINITY_DN49461_c0_g1_i1.p1  ORF type:complete len:425 (-),score=32.34 TRINITY_DN49461_c0_g1_i1:101-1375(-)
MASLVNKVEYDSDDENAVLDEQNEEVIEENNEPEEITTLENPDVVTKYLEAAKIANQVLQEVMALCVVGAKVFDICVAGDKSIEDKCSLIYRNKVKGVTVTKGVAFPVCVSINECVCNMSPLASDDQNAPGMTICENDIIKVDLGVHIDGYIAVAAHTFIVGVTPNTTPPVTDERANVFNAARTVGKLVERLFVPGNTSTQVVEACNKVINAYDGVCSLEGVTMHQMKRFIIDGNKTVVLKPAEDSKKTETCTFELYETYAIDVCLTSGDGKSREGNQRTTIYKRNVDKTYSLKMQASRKVFNEVNKRFPTMPFTLRALDDERNSKMGIRECVNHDLLASYPICYEKKGDIVVHVRFTLLLLPNGTLKISGFDIAPNNNGMSLFPPPIDMAPIDQNIAELLAKPDVVRLSKKERKAAAAAAKKK